MERKWNEMERNGTQWNEMERSTGGASGTQPETFFRKPLAETEET